MTTVTSAGGISDRALRRMVRWGAVALAILLVAFTVVYALGQRVDHGPTLTDRQVAAAEDAVRAAPQNVQNRLLLASAYQQAGRVDDAVAQLDEVLKAVPANNTALLALGQLKLKQGDLDGATALLTKITKAAATAEFANVDPQREAAHYWLATIAQQRKDYDAAVTEATAALAIDSSDADAWYLLGTAQSAKGQDKVAVESLKRSLLFVPTGWCDPYSALSASYSKLSLADESSYAGAMADFCNGRTDAARSRLESLTTGPASLDALLGLGLIAETSSDRTGAADWYQKALAASPGNPTALTALSRLGVKPTTSGAAASAAPSTQGS